MNDTFLEMAKQVPAAMAVVGVVYLFLKYMENQELKRIANAKEMGDVERNHELQMSNLQRSRDLEMNNLWASTVRNIMDNQNKSSAEITAAITKMQEEMVVQYEKMGITKDLWNIARKEAGKKNE